MKINACVVLFLIFTSASLSFSQETGDKLTLERCFSLALEKHESVRIKNETRVQKHEQLIQARRTLLPEASFRYSAFYRDNAGGSVSGQGSDSRLLVSQTIFDRFRKKYGITYSISEEKIEEYLYYEAVRDLKTDVIKAFYSVKKNDTDKNNINESLKLMAAETSRAYARKHPF